MLAMGSFFSNVFMLLLYYLHVPRPMTQYFYLQAQSRSPATIKRTQQLHQLHQQLAKEAADDCKHLKAFHRQAVSNEVVKSDAPNLNPEQLHPTQTSPFSFI